MSKLGWTAVVLVACGGAMQVFAGCGSDPAGGDLVNADAGDVTNDTTGAEDTGLSGDGDTQDGGGSNDATLDGKTIVDGARADAPVCKPVSQACTKSADCCSANCVGNACAAPLGVCKQAGTACTVGTDCCTLSCIGNVCANQQCVADNLACGSNAECCGGSCVPSATGGGVCKPLNTSCKTSGNPCGTGADCCSKLCNNGTCSNAVSFCAQTGDVCADNFACCGGNCEKAAGATLGSCGAVASAPGATQCEVKGSVCSTADAGAPSCGGTCCSRICAPSGSVNGIFICEPPSGCSPTGELCRTDKDCCGSTGSPPPVNGAVSCSKASATQEFGRCDNGTVCREPGSICKPSTSSCSAENNCCEPNGAPSAAYCNQNPDNCCRKDSLGIPRCLLNANTCTAPIAAGTSCVTSADCCGNPCVNNMCLAACVPSAGACTTTADCCTGLPCTIPTGASKGTCGGTIAADGGVVTPSGDAGNGGGDASAPLCALYGQSCSATACCNGVPCTNNVCRYP